MLEESLFNIPYYTLPTLNFKVKKKQLTNLLKSYPEKKQGIQPFSTNRQSNRDGLIQVQSPLTTRNDDLTANFGVPYCRATGTSNKILSYELQVRTCAQFAAGSTDPKDQKLRALISETVAA